LKDSLDKVSEEEKEEVKEMIEIIEKELVSLEKDVTQSYDERKIGKIAKEEIKQLNKADFQKALLSFLNLKLE
jgi:hypothetical protein